MRIIVVGGNGTIGSAVVKELSRQHEVISVGYTRGDLTCDITSEDSIRSMYEKAGKFHAVVSATGKVVFDDFSEMNSAKYQIGLMDKLMGQVNLVLIGRRFIEDQGSFTLTSGILAHDPIRKGSSASMVNNAIQGFVRGAAIEFSNGIRINAVSPTILTESMEQYGSLFRGYNPAPAHKVALAYVKSVEGLQTGQVYTVGY